MTTKVNKHKSKNNTRDYLKAGKNEPSHVQIHTPPDLYGFAYVKAMPKYCSGDVAF